MSGLDTRSKSTYIDGAWRDGESSETYTSWSPSTEQAVGTAQLSSPEQVDAAVASARAAFEGDAWRAYGPKDRARVVNRLADLLEKNTEPLARLIADEVGTPIGAARGMQVGGPVEALRWYAEMAERGPRGGYSHALPLYDKPVLSTSLLRYEPAGVLAALPAYNYPINLLAWKLGGALASGCTTVVLPSPQGMQTTLRVFELIEELDLPPGVVNLVVGGPDVGKRLTGHPDVNLVSFTGSDAVGGQVMSQSALGSLSKAVLELGGKSPNIILPGADLDSTVGPSILRFARNAGQGCAAWSRVLVPRDRLDEFCEKADAFIKTIAVGDPQEDDTVVGPVISAEHRAKVEGLVSDAVAAGATVVAGGGRPDLPTGHYLNPAILTGVDVDAPIAQTELFAPIAIALPYSDVDEAVRIANATSYGLAANVFGPLDEAMPVAERVRSGTVTINGGAGMRPDAPWGGPGRSGVGRELGEDGFAEFFEVKHIQWPLAGVTRPPGT
ncbi:aldehyde dehydrogenase (NAD+)/betaine-aldehyde dehydrogenase [Prauserella isguenensis]|uniref:Aldehyde dehydrogenase (NAD+)/betaine-aldehyde dehydrogenase n=1 Tax=Prauserella isguenensis TaxID=1470180 RepID=A0A839S3V6_9PSEU|nr:aldehyde dehydrogenase family protein [Prauserella isguenensis]MBB3051439.1 aldehyde dehydrogenase (NAD+)/betaine-aldehyde dehydrogenase [Prauserella isguenensis]